MTRSRQCAEQVRYCSGTLQADHYMLFQFSMRCMQHVEKHSAVCSPVMQAPVPQLTQGVQCEPQVCYHILAASSMPVALLQLTPAPWAILKACHCVVEKPFKLPLSHASCLH